MPIHAATISTIRATKLMKASSAMIEPNAAAVAEPPNSWNSEGQQQLEDLEEHAAAMAPRHILRRGIWSGWVGSQ